MRAFCPDASESDLQRGQHSKKRLLVAFHESLDSFGRGSLWGIVDLFRRFELFPDLSKGDFQIGPADTAPEMTVEPLVLVI